MEQFVRKFILRNRYTLLASVIVCVVLVVIVEGLVTNRESRVYTFDNPFFELDLNNIEQWQNRSLRNR